MAETIREHIRQQGYDHQDLYQRWPSIRLGTFQKFMNGDLQASGRLLHSFAEASGLWVEPSQTRFRPSMAPRRHHAGSDEAWGLRVRT